MDIKPLGHKSYGSIGHLVGSRVGPGDHTITAGQTKICTEKVRDRHDRVIVLEKLDGTNVSVANIDGQIVPLARAGWTAASSPREMHHLFDRWVRERLDWFAFLKPGERLCGEWLAQAHGTRYHMPKSDHCFVAFDLMRAMKRVTWPNMMARLADAPVSICVPKILAHGPTSLDEADRLLGSHGHHGAIDRAEGVVYRVERSDKEEVDFLAKWVRPDKGGGQYLIDLAGGLPGNRQPVWNWRP